MIGGTLLLTAMTAGAAEDARGMLGFMHGHWQGSGVTLSIDVTRQLANADPTKPFQRQPLRIRDIADGMVVFFIGHRRYVGLFEGDTLTLTGDGLPGTATLRRRTTR